MNNSKEQINPANETEAAYENIDDKDFSTLSDDEKNLIVAKRVLKRHIKAFKNLAKS